jgi:hypothetical protein
MAAALAGCCLVLGGWNAPDDDGWITLLGSSGQLEAWKQPTDGWSFGSDAKIDPANERQLVREPGSGVISNDPKGKAKNLVSKQSFGAIEFHGEFLVPVRANSGVKFEGLYEIQIHDSFGVKDLKGSDCGGIYPRAMMQPKYHHIDNGFPPRSNACLPAGQWQNLDVVFQPPRFDAVGKKVADARFVKVSLNGVLIHQNVDVASPTGNAWETQKEIPKGPILLQGDHGFVAFRNIRVRPLLTP